MHDAWHGVQCWPKKNIFWDSDIPPTSISARNNLKLQELHIETVLSNWVETFIHINRKLNSAVDPNMFLKIKIIRQISSYNSIFYFIICLYFC